MYTFISRQDKDSFYLLSILNAAFYPRDYKLISGIQKKCKFLHETAYFSVSFWLFKKIITEYYAEKLRTYD